jgi:hypothetical protein
MRALSLSDIIITANYVGLYMVHLQLVFSSHRENVLTTGFKYKLDMYNVYADIICCKDTVRQCWYIILTT